MPDALTQLHQARKRRDRAEGHLLVALREARKAGHTLQELADVVGCTRQRVYQLLGPTGRPTRTQG